jgi:hypothetical protein
MISIDLFICSICIDDDFIDVPVRAQACEPIVLPETIDDDYQQEKSSDAFISDQNDTMSDSSNSTAIEDIQTFIHEHDKSMSMSVRMVSVEYDQK